MCQAVGPCPHCAIYNDTSATAAGLMTPVGSYLRTSYIIISHSTVHFMCLTVHGISLGHVNNVLLKSIRPRLICHNSFILSLFSLVLIVRVWPHSIFSLALCVPVSCIELRNCSRKFIAYRPFGAYRFCISVLSCLSFVAFFVLFLFSVHFSLFLCFSLFLTKIRKWKGVSWRVGCNPTCPYDSFLVRNWVGRMRPWQTVFVGANFKGLM